MSILEQLRRWTRWSPLGKVRIHPLLIVLVLLAVGLGLWRDVVVLFTLVTLHELGHAAVAESLGYEVEEVSLLPFGGVARLSYGDIGFVPRHEVLIAVAGPIVNFLLVLIALGLHRVGAWNHSFTQMTIRLNLWIALFNLLPAMPLDGGRILRAARSRWNGFERATWEALVMGIILGIVLLVMGGIAWWAGFPHAGLVILAAFLIYSSLIGIRGIRMETVRFLDAKRRRHTGVEQVNALAVSGHVPVRDVVQRLSPDGYHVIYVLDSNGQLIDEVAESELLDAVFAGRWMDPLNSLRRTLR